MGDDIIFRVFPKKDLSRFIMIYLFADMLDDNEKPTGYISQVGFYSDQASPRVAYHPDVQTPAGSDAWAGDPNLADRHWTVYSATHGADVPVNDSYLKVHARQATPTNYDIRYTLGFLMHHHGGWKPYMYDPFIKIILDD
ncbi:MAG: hypothetical protein ETSY2_32385 [Candidatus Entotheonella gemina]|uniref:Uncharacterized protein n=1 Tax=Candidatus Entotheonella gemina TaxID=1429439 RepID=W4M0W5_9BACT|nr:MAG: hypothetical protein ETSY2_32385 [Candidatus Entotheonella gemina]